MLCQLTLQIQLDKSVDMQNLRLVYFRHFHVLTFLLKTFSLLYEGHINTVHNGLICFAFQMTFMHISVQKKDVFELS